MTRDEFVQGWNLLVAQPWGKRYTATRDQSSAQTSATQLTFYFKKLGSYPSGAWFVACELFAQGDHWPSIDEMRTTINHSLPQRMKIEYNTEASECAEPIALAHAHADAHSTTILEAVQTVFPKWIAENADHPDRERAEALLELFRGKKPARFINARLATKQGR